MVDYTSNIDTNYYCRRMYRLSGRLEINRIEVTYLGTYASAVITSDFVTSSNGFSVELPSYRLNSAINWLAYE